MQTSTRLSDPERFKKLYHHYIEKAARLEREVNEWAAALKVKYAVDSNTGLPRNSTDIDKMVGSNETWKRLVADQQFAERHALMYGHGYVVEALGQLHKTLRDVAQQSSMERSLNRLGTLAGPIEQMRRDASYEDDLWPIEGHEPPKVCVIPDCDCSGLAHP